MPFYAYSFRIFNKFKKFNKIINAYKRYLFKACFIDLNNKFYFLQIILRKALDILALMYSRQYVFEEKENQKEMFNSQVNSVNLKESASTRQYTQVKSQDSLHVLKL